MCQPFRLLVTASRTWTDVRTIEQVLTGDPGPAPRRRPAGPWRLSPRSRRHRRRLRGPHPWLLGRGASGRLAPVRASGRVPAERRDDRARRRRLCRVHPRQQPVSPFPPAARTHEEPYQIPGAAPPRHHALTASRVRCAGPVHRCLGSVAAALWE